MMDKRLFLLVTLTIAVAWTQAEKKFSPLILVPGDGGSRIFARSHPSHWLCLIDHSWHLIWLNSILFLLPWESCLETYFRLYYNYTTRQSYNYPGVETRIDDWGGVSSIDYLGYLHTSYETLFAPMTDRLVKEGYEVYQNLRGAPFDFRQAPNGNEDFFPKLKALVEDTYHRNNNSRVMLLCHSMGNLYLNYFLNGVSKEWKKKFVRGYVAVSAPVGGAVKSLLAATAGIQFSKEILSMKPVAEVLRSIPSTVFNFPSPLFWDSDEILARRPSRNYTVDDFRQLFLDIPYPAGWEMYKDTRHLIDPRWAPDLDEVYCVHGYDLPTPKVLEWDRDKDFPYQQPKIHTGDGDGTVNIRSLRGCDRWPGVKLLTYKKAEHKKILGDERFLDRLVTILRQPE